jgi:GrpB-like predicted nucleotidyltransferase (UPF0157 family)
MSLGLQSGLVQLAAHNPAWAAAFAFERARLLAAVGPHPLAIEHIGSTAIPGIPAKPILDLLAGRSLDHDVAAYVTAFEAAGYQYRGEHGIPGRDYFVLDDAAGRRTHHLHLVEEGGALWRSHLTFRDLLRARPERAAEYAALKQSLADRYPADREAYTEGKAAFVAAMLRLAAGDSLTP